MRITLPLVELRVFGTMLVLFVNGVDAREGWTLDEADLAHDRKAWLLRELTSEMITREFDNENKVRRCFREVQVSWESFIAAFPVEVQRQVR